MGYKTKISWCQTSQNFWIGCTKVDPGCDNCYMFRDMRRYGNDPEKVRRTKTTFNNPLKWKKPRLIFTCSWGDFFHVDADPWRDEAWDIIRRTPHHTYQILTKRHGRIQKNLPSWWPMSHVWLGVSGCDNDGFHQRAKALRDVPGNFTRFISAEPLIGPIDVTAEQLVDYKINWMIIGGESGPGARPMELSWAKTIKDACVEANIPVFLKQLGGHPSKRADEAALLDGQLWTQMPHTFNQLELL
ncbi:hypothetical protein LCGC14_1252530 [marine sediment metagenome]|uniref:Phage protein Gp37/Gp68 n=1 Tax=marine sediment metagenome TaxID=412755 RepID=A0A0F9LP94_9ZZZZ